MLEVFILTESNKMKFTLKFALINSRLARKRLDEYLCWLLQESENNGLIEMIEKINSVIVTELSKIEKLGEIN